MQPKLGLQPESTDSLKKGNVIFTMQGNWTPPPECDPFVLAFLPRTY
uniref:Uncharacterized protein n=1 Tax=Anguilla anguilla TaxID=7936 RepID=A0A0E9RQ90_ANGAN